MTTLYFDKKGEPVLRNSFCMFLDVLGFNDLMRKTLKKSQASQLLLNFYDVHKSSSSHWASMNAIWEYKCFTDNVVFGCPLDIRDIDSEGKFGSVYISAGYHQLEMALAGFFVRGGMAVGPLHISENFVFGHAISDAYSLESQAADVPRIVIGQTVMKEVYTHLQSYAKVSYAPQDEGILVDEDGQFFLNYLDALIDTYEMDGIGFDGFKRHAKLVAEKIATAKLNKVRAKYEWVARYHNHVIERQILPVLKASRNLKMKKDLIITGFSSQHCRSLSEFIRTDPRLSKRFKGRLQCQSQYQKLDLLRRQPRTFPSSP